MPAQPPVRRPTRTPATSPPALATISATRAAAAYDFLISPVCPVPPYAADAEGKKTRLDAHIRLANPRTPGQAGRAANLILRRPFNYSNGVTKSGQLEMGLLFICYQADLAQGFTAVQKRLDGEPLEEYIKPIGGGFFFVLPGLRDAGDWYGRSLLAASKDAAV